VARAGGIPELKGIIKDDYASLLSAAHSALEAVDVLVISAGSYVSTRDLTADVMNERGKPGVVVHGAAGLFLTPLLRRMQGLKNPPARRRETARLAHNLSSVPGREDYVQVRLVERKDQLWAEPVFGKSNLIYTMVKAEGMVCVPLDSNGLHQGEQVEVELF
jgi:molybdopterin molybdotransferase